MSTEFVIAPPKINSIPVEGDARRFAVNRIFCVGRNYADHAREMGHDHDGKFSSVTKQLPRLKAMGIDIIWLMPIHPIGVKNRTGKVDF